MNSAIKTYKEDVNYQFGNGSNLKNTKELYIEVIDIEKTIKTRGTLNTNLKVELEKSGDLLHKIYLYIDLLDFQIVNAKHTITYIKNMLFAYGITWNIANSNELLTEYKLVEEATINFLSAFCVVATIFCNEETAVHFSEEKTSKPARFGLMATTWFWKAVSFE